MPGVVQQTARAYVEAKERARAAIRDAEAEADKGVFISSDATDKWVRSWGSEGELPPSKPDVEL